jgi:hypothetical protein
LICSLAIGNAASTASIEVDDTVVAVARPASRNPKQQRIKSGEVLTTASVTRLQLPGSFGGDGLMIEDLSGSAQRRRDPTSFGYLERMKCVTRFASARRIARRLAAGLQLSAGERQRYEALPVAVREAVDAAARPDSRYTPARLASYRRAADAAWREGRAIVAAEWSKDLAAVERDRTLGGWSEDAASKLALEAAAIRVVTIVPPWNVPGAGRIRAAVAKEAGVNENTLRDWEGSYRREYEPGRKWKGHRPR